MSLSNESKEYLDQYKAAPPVPPRWLDLHAKFWAGGQAGGATTADVVHLVSSIDKRLDWPIMIRPDYLQVWAGVLDRLKRSSARATVLRGQPGVGKSLCLRFLAVACCEMGQPFLFTTTARREQFYPLFTSEGVRMVADFQVAELSFDSHRLLILCDAVGPDPVDPIIYNSGIGDSYLVLASLPNVNRYKELAKETCADYYIFQFWHHAETANLLRLIHHHYTAADSSSVPVRITSLSPPHPSLLAPPTPALTATAPSAVSNAVEEDDIMDDALEGGAGLTRLERLLSEEIIGWYRQEWRALRRTSYDPIQLYYILTPTARNILGSYSVNGPLDPSRDLLGHIDLSRLVSNLPRAYSAALEGRPIDDTDQGHGFHTLFVEEPAQPFTFSPSPSVLIKLPPALRPLIVSGFSALEAQQQIALLGQAKSIPAIKCDETLRRPTTPSS
ncbi:hypothetical protein Rhopal_003418-T1 [Rhodotorula paludigena]|uniref:Uncharacterized protein n=1 Tax=Rhodotorula paludigena TaxID=86838 RepID=A0AAV5GLQ2_9BASI|nr:hypothetical protein Rhopal_003418-T1 [Rhodotorula paludigena]